MASAKTFKFNTGATVGTIGTTFADNDTSLMTSQAIKEKIEDYGYSTEVGTVTAVTGTGAISSTGGTTPEISVATADTDTTGVLTDADWDTFNNKSTVAQLSDLSDVGVTTATDKNALMADGDSWESRALVEADISDLGTYALTNQTMYIGTTQVAINRGSATLNLAGIGTLGVGAITTTGNFSQTGATTFGTGTGAISLNGDVTLAVNKDLTMSGTGAISGATSISGTTLTDGTFSVTGGAITGATGNISLWTNDSAYIDLTDLSSTATGLTYTNGTEFSVNCWLCYSNNY